MLQSESIVQAQTLHIDHLQTLLAHAANRCCQVRQLSVRKHITTNKASGAAPYGPAIDMTGRDAVIEYQPARAYLLGQDTEVIIQIGVSDVLKHANADDLVILLTPRQIAVIAQLQPYLLA